MADYTILIADDSRMTRMLLAGMVQTLLPRARVLEARDSEEALEMAQATELHAATLDFNMPGMNGLELAQALRGHYPDIHMGLITADLDPDTRAQVEAADLCFIGKPISEENLRDFLHQHLVAA